MQPIFLFHLNHLPCFDCFPETTIIFNFLLYQLLLLDSPSFPFFVLLLNVLPLPVLAPIVFQVFLFDFLASLIICSPLAGSNSFLQSIFFVLVHNSIASYTIVVALCFWAFSLSNIPKSLSGTTWFFQTPFLSSFTSALIEARPYFPPLRWSASILFVLTRKRSENQF